MKRLVATTIGKSIYRTVLLYPLFMKILVVVTNNFEKNNPISVLSYSTSCTASVAFDCVIFDIRGLPVSRMAFVSSL